MTTKPHKKAHVWVVEILCDGKWEPCSTCSTLKARAQDDAREWRERNPDDRFRVTRYERAV